MLVPGRGDRIGRCRGRRVHACALRNDYHHEWHKGMRKGGRGPHLLPLPPLSLPLILSLASPSSLSRFYDRSRISIRDRDNRHAIEARREIVRAVGFVQCQIARWWGGGPADGASCLSPTQKSLRRAVRSFVRSYVLSRLAGHAGFRQRSLAPRRRDYWRLPI